MPTRRFSVKNKEIHEFDAELFVQARGSKIDSDSISKILGIRPTPTSQKWAKTPKFGSWVLRSSRRRTATLQQHLESILRKVSPRRVRLLQKKMPRLRVLVRCAHYTNLDDGFCQGPILTARIVQKLSDYGADMTLDTYAGTEFGKTIAATDTSHSLVSIREMAASSKHHVALFIGNGISNCVGSSLRHGLSIPTSSWAIEPTVKRDKIDGQLRDIKNQLNRLKRSTPRTTKSGLCWISTFTASGTGFCGIIRLKPKALELLAAIGSNVCLENHNQTQK